MNVQGRLPAKKHLLGTIADSKDAKRFAALLAPAYKAAGWRWGGGNGRRGTVPDSAAIYQTIERLCKEVGVEVGYCLAATGGLRVELKGGRKELCVDQKLGQRLKDA